MKGKLYIKTHGCQMNEYDSGKMADVLASSHGLELTEREEDADVIGKSFFPVGALETA
jgi:tRNA-2-methylthio-N6-dimethylallyladenosine synthase